MTRLIVYYRRDDKEESINIPCDTLKEQNGFVYAYEGENLVAVLDLGRINIAYLARKA